MDINILLNLLLFLSVYVLVSADGCNNVNCQASNGSTCNDKGTCDCGVCKCEDGYWGPTCEECATCPSPCEVFRHCVGCKIFGTGEMSVIDCLNMCDYLANYLPVEKEDFDTISMTDERILCTQFNEEQCMESFRIGGMTDGYRDLYVRTEMDCEAPIPTTTTTTTLSVIEIDVTDDSAKDETNNVKYDNGKQAAGAVSGTGDISDQENAACSILERFHVLSLILSLVLTLLNSCRV